MYIIKAIYMFYKYTHGKNATIYVFIAQMVLFMTSFAKLV